MKVHLLKNHGPVALAATLATFVIPPIAAGETWDGGGTDNAISTKDNWAGDRAPVSDLAGTSLIFAGNTRLTPDFTAPFSAKSLTFDNTAGAFTTSGSPFSVGTGGVINASSKSQTFNNAVVVGTAAGKFSANGGPLIFGNTVSLGLNALELGGPKDFIFSAPVSGKGTVTKTGAGTLVLTAASALTDADFNLDAGLTTLTGMGTHIFTVASSIAVNNTASLSLDADTILDGALLTLNNGAELGLNGGKTLTIRNGGDFSTSGSQYLSDGGTVDVTGSGSTFTAAGAGFPVQALWALSLSSNAAMNISAGAAASTGIGALAVGLSGQGAVLVEGPGSSLAAGSIAVAPATDSTGTLTFKDKSAGAFGPVRISDTASTGASGSLNVESGSTVTGTSLSIAGRHALNSGTVTVTGADSALTLSGAATTAIGAAGGSNAVLRLLAGGAFYSGAGPTTIYATGSAEILHGSFHANGDLLLDGGRMSCFPEGSFKLAAGKGFTIQQEGDATIPGHWAPGPASVITVKDANSRLFAGSLSLDAGSSLQVLAAAWASAISVAVGAAGNGAGTVTVDGLSSRLGGTSLLVGGDGSEGTVTFSGGSTGGFNESSDVDSGIRVASGALRIESGATVFASQLDIADASVAGTARLLITGPDSELLLDGLRDSIIGAGSTGTAAVQVQDGGTFVTGIGTVTVAATGTIDADSGRVVSRGDFTLDGGRFNGAGKQSLMLMTDTTLAVQAGGQAVFSGDFSQSLRADLHITGPGSAFVAGGDISWDGPWGFSSLTVSDGGLLSSGGALHLAPHNTFVSLSVSGAGSRLVTGPSSASEWQTDVFFSSSASADLGSLRLADLPTASVMASLQVDSGATASLHSIAAATSSSPNVAKIIVSGPGSSVVQTGSSTLTLGSDYNGAAVLQVEDGGTFASGTGPVILNATGVMNIDGGTVNLRGPLTDNGGSVNFNSGALGLASDFKVGTGGLLGDASLTLAADRSFSTVAHTTISPFRTLTIDGGTFRTGSLTNNGTLAFLRGTLGITGPGGFSIGAGALGGSVTLRDGALLDVAKTTLVSPGASLRLDGGGLHTGLLDIAGTVRVDRGTAAPDGLAVRGGGRLFVSDTLAFASAGSNSILTDGRLTLDDGALVTGQGTLACEGLVTGDGVIAVPFENRGEVRAESGRMLHFAAATAPDTGRCNLQGGALSWAKPFICAASGQINGSGELYAPSSPVPAAGQPSAGLNLHGQMNLSGGHSLIFGTVALHPGGRLIAGGGSTAAFFDVFRHNGEAVKAGAGSALVFFGEVRGPGSFTGDGIVSMEGGYSPGSSPAAVSISPQMLFADTNVLTMELGGPAPGTEHDQLAFSSTASPQVSWGGNLTVTLINGFTPFAGQIFDLFNFDPSCDSGAFASLTLPSLPNGLTWDTAGLYTTGSLRVVPASSQTPARWDESVSGPPSGDHDHDGLDNLTEFALGLTSPNPDTLLPVGSLHSYPDGQRLRLLFTRPLDRSGLTLRVQAAGDLGEWTDLAVSVDSAPFTGPGFVSENRAHPLSAPGLVEVRDILTTATAPRRQIRLLITLSPW